MYPFTHPKHSFQLLAVCVVLIMLGATLSQHAGAQAAGDQSPFVPEATGPVVHPPVLPINLDATADEGLTDDQPAISPPLKYVPGTEPKGPSQTIANWVDAVAQTDFGVGLMPLPIDSFDGMGWLTNSANHVWPPDTNGDVSPDLYIQSVNSSIAIYEKDGTLTEPAQSFNDFFTGSNVYCDIYNRGDPVVVYDRFAQRWVVSDFAHNSDYGPFYECIAVSKTMTPTLSADDWWMYAIEISDSSLNDYPKLGVWRDGYYLSFNMFTLEPSGWEWDGVQVWALDKAAMLSGAPAAAISFTLGPSTNYYSLMPAHALDLPPEGAPAYFGSVEPPDKFQLWEFQANWADPYSSTLSGPDELTVADFAIAASVPQPVSSILLDSLSYRPMMQLIYRNTNDTEALWMNHTVASNGVAGVRWYEVRDPAGSPSLYQQGTYQPDGSHRWMGSLAVDQEGNMAVGYSLSSESIFPGIYYAGRLSGETPGLLPQSEQALIAGAGSQLSYSRWGDYSHMAVDPTDDCTFWYTTEYYSTTGVLWQTRIGSFKFPSCGAPKGYITGVVRDSLTSQPIPNAPVTADSTSMTFSAQADEYGSFTIPLIDDIYGLTAGPSLPGYSTPDSVGGLVVTAGITITQDLYLDPAPNLVEDSRTLDDDIVGGNNNGYAEPGETGLLLWNQIENTGATTSTNISATLSSSTTGVSVDTADADYPDIPAGGSDENLTPFEFSIDSSLACGSELQFQKVVTDSVNTYNLEFTLNAGIPLTRTPIFENDVESGDQGWTTGGTLNTWAISSESSHSPDNAWNDSPGANYPNSANSYLQSPSYNLGRKGETELSFWVTHSLEAGYDYVYLDYSLDGGSSWSDDNNALAVFNGQQDWHQVFIDASILDDQPNIALRFRLVTDSGVADDGIVIDDIVLSYQPYYCTYGMEQIYLPIVITE
jgi:hypothetical protein